MDEQKHSFPIIPLLLGLAVVVVLGGAAKKQWLRSNQAASEQKRLVDERGKAEFRRGESAAHLKERTEQLEKVNKFLSTWSDPYRRGAGYLTKGGQFTAYTNRLVEGSGVIRQTTEPGSGIEQGYIAIGDLSVPARTYRVEFVGNFEPLLRVIGTFEQDIDLIACSRIEFRVIEKHIQCSYFFAYPALNFPDDSMPSAKGGQL